MRPSIACQEQIGLRRTKSQRLRLQATGTTNLNRIPDRTALKVGIERCPLDSGLAFHSFPKLLWFGLEDLAGLEGA